MLPTAKHEEIAKTLNKEADQRYQKKAKNLNYGTDIIEALDSLYKDSENLIKEHKFVDVKFKP